MCKRMIYLASFVLVLGFVNSAMAIQWTGGGANNLWSTPANWEGNKVPTASDEAYVDVPGAEAPHGPLIQDGIDAECDLLACEVAGEPTMTMTGGTLTISGWGIWWGDGPDCNPTFYQSGGTMTLAGSPGIHEFGWGGASGTWVMTGGTVNAKGVSIPSGPGNFGTILLHGGTYNVGTERGGLVMREGGLIDITEGTLVLEGDQTANINDLIDAGQITSYDGAGVFELDYDQRNPGMTTLTAMKAGKAYNPNPADGAIYSDTFATLAWTAAENAVSHNVYFGDNFEDVDNGIADAFVGNQTENFLIVGFMGYPVPDGLVPGTTYYWRIDEVNDTDPDNPSKGSVWSFSIPPKIAYNPSPADGAESVDPNVELIWTAGLNAIVHTVYFGDDYDVVNNATGGTGQSPAHYSPGTLELAKVYYWRVDEYDTVDTYKGDIWSFTTPGAVGSPVPANGAKDVKLMTILSWTAADNAASHEVYLGKDKDAVRNADKNSPEYKGSKSLGDESYDPGKLSWYADYYWRIDEVDSLGNTQKGPLWSFMTADFISIDDFEDYDAGENQIWYSWGDGLGYGTPDTPPYSAGNGTGSAVGDESTPSYCEEIIVHGGRKSMPVAYDNNKQGYAYYSEVAKTLTYPRNWTDEGVGELVIWFRGQADNDPEPLYVAISNNAGTPAIVVNDDPAAAQVDVWTKWVISLQTIADQGIDLTNVDKIVLGIGTQDNLTTPGGAGKMFFDDISLNRLEPVDPGNDGLLAYYALDGDANDISGNGNDGTINNADTGGLGDGGSVWVDDPERGMVISFNGDNSSGAYVSTDLTIPAMTMENDFTWAFWAKQDESQGTEVPGQGDDLILGNRYAADGSDPLEFIKFTPGNFEYYNNDPDYTVTINYDDIPGGVWIHHTGVKDGTTLTYYRNGVEAGTSTITFTIQANPFFMGGIPNGERWSGNLSDVRIYNRALSGSEVLYLASN
jgi:hypothetical protein